jgi:PBP1b-binding outer membrane lipoprotein LpoB
MKKSILIISLLFLSVILVGCGSKHQITCTLEQDSSDATIKAYFNNKESKLVKLEMSLVIETNDEKVAKEYVKSACEENEYENCKTKIDGTKVIIKYEQNKIDKNEQSKLKDAKKEFEKKGFKCTKK